MDYDYKDKTFSTVEFFKTDFNFKLYDLVIVNFKANDQKYKIHSLGGVVDYIDNIVECYNKKDEVADSIAKLLTNSQRKEEHKIKSVNPALDTFSYVYFFTEQGDRISVECYDWLEKSVYNDQLRIGIFDKKMWHWLQNDAY